MPFVRELGSERIEFRDRVTGVHITQITSFPVMSNHFYIEHPSFTSDCSTLVIRSQRVPARAAPWDLYACDADGLNLRQLTDEDDANNFALAHEGSLAWYQRGTSLWSVDVGTGERREVCGGPPGVLSMGYWCGCASPDGKFYFGYGRRRSDDQGVVIRYRTDGTEAVVLAADPHLCHLHASPGGHGISFGGVNERGEGVQYGMNHDGTNLRVLPTATLSHFTWAGTTKRFVGAGMWERRVIHTIEEGQRDSSVVVEGSFFWHTGISWDAEWTVADTNWPNEGLMIVNIRARQYARLCLTDNTAGHPQWTHAHPAFSPDGKRVVYTSDRTGICQVYVADVPEEFKAWVATPNPEAAPGGRLPEWRPT